MRIDTHFHFIGRGRDITKTDEEVYFVPEDNQHWFTRLLYNLIEEDIKKLGGDLNRDGTISTEEYSELIYRILTTSEEIDAVVLLALDGVYSLKTGELDLKRTDLLVSNRILARKVAELNERLKRQGYENKRFYFGASVNPNRRDWASELEYVVTQNEAVLLKLIPSVQHINLLSPRHREFYDTLVKYNMPLLCHVGPEYSFPEGLRHRDLDNFRNLEGPLDRGVRVIAAHCATPVFPLVDRNETKEFYRFMSQANAGGTVLWADTSALSLSTRAWLVPEIVELFPEEWLLHGSDFPIPIDGWTHLPYLSMDVTFQEYLEIVKTKNPLDRDVKIKRAFGFSDSILENARRVLRIGLVE